MTRKYLAAFTAVAAVAFVNVLAGTGCSPTGVGDPCIPEAEYAPDFLGFDPAEVNVESKSFQCLTRLCLVNHFQGRVSCPYGQTGDATKAYSAASAPTGFECNGKDGASTSPNSACCVPGVNQQVISDQDCPGEANGKACTSLSDGPAGATPVTPKVSSVLPNCTDRTSDKAVYCSCRCANVDGKTDDGANYCSCPSGFSCTQLVTPIGAANAQLTGAYCIKNGTTYDVANACSSKCDPSQHAGQPGYCGPTNGPPQ